MEDKKVSTRKSVDTLKLKLNERHRKVRQNENNKSFDNKRKVLYKILFSKIKVI